MGHKIGDRFLFNGLPGTDERHDKAPTPCGISLVTVFDHSPVGLGTLGGIPHDTQRGPTRGHKRVHHLAKHDMFAALMGLVLRQKEAKAPGTR
jgi:hypothetical protein